MAIAANLPLASSNGSFLITPSVGLMVWTLVVFGLTMLVLWRLAFPPIARAIDRRKQTIEESMDHAERVRHEADEILAQYRERLKEARAQADEIVGRSRESAATHERETEEEARQRAAQLLERAERDIEGATRRALQEIRGEVAQLTVAATEKLTRKSLSDADQRRLVEEALSELDFSELSPASRN